MSRERESCPRQNIGEQHSSPVTLHGASRPKHPTRRGRTTGSTLTAGAFSHILRVTGSVSCAHSGRGSAKAGRAAVRPNTTAKQIKTDKRARIVLVLLPFWTAAPAV